jgi:hypothetical protein
MSLLFSGGHSSWSKAGHSNWRSPVFTIANEWRGQPMVTPSRRTTNGVAPILVGSGPSIAATCERRQCRVWLVFVIRLCWLPLPSSAPPISPLRAVAFRQSEPSVLCDITHCHSQLRNLPLLLYALENEK